MTSSSTQPPLDVTEVRWRRRPVLAGLIRIVVICAPLAAAIAAGVFASRAFRPHGWGETVGWIVWTGAVSFVVLALVDAAARRLLPLQRLLQLCLVFPDRAPSRVRVAARAARPRRPEAWQRLTATQQDAAAAAAMIVELLGSLAVHDRRTRGHSERVCAYTELLAEQMNLGQRERDRLMWVALVHDIGKLRVPSRLLNKPGRPTVAEWEVLQAHPVHGAHIVEPLRAWLGEWADAVLQHHERYDGLGYPHQLQGAQLCLGARIIAVTDAFEVMTAPRAYRRPVDAQSARAELARHAGTQFDPDVVRQFLAVGLPQLRRSMGLLAWIGQIPFIRSWPQLQSNVGVTATQTAAVTAVASTAGALLVAPGIVAPAAAAQQPAGAAITHATVASDPTGPADASAATATSVTSTTQRVVAKVAQVTRVARVNRTRGTSSSSTVVGETTAGGTANANACDPPGRHLGWTKGRGNDVDRHTTRHANGC